MLFTLSTLLLFCFILLVLLQRDNNRLKANAATSAIEKATAETRATEYLGQITTLSNELALKTTELNQLKEEYSKLSERIKFIEEEKERLTNESELRFKNLATEILANNTQTFKEQNETRLSEILAPFKENIEQFKRTITESYSNEARERFSLQEKIKELIELNQFIGKEAKDLTIALKGNSKVQGDWGEMVLESILEKSGLEKGREFTVQTTTHTDGGNRLRADVIINYPDGRKVVIDSKVSLTAYVNFINAEDSEEQERYKKQHLTSIKSHIADLRDKKYQDYLGDKCADFVMMFIPNEAAYLAAMQFDGNIWQEAYDSRVLLISPTHLISVLRLVEQLWIQDRQTRHAIDIAIESGKMYDKLVGFVEDMKKIEKTLGQTQEAYSKAMNKLTDGTGNLIGRAEKLRAMGAKATKMIPKEVLTIAEEFEP